MAGGLTTDAQRFARIDESSTETAENFVATYVTAQVEMSFGATAGKSGRIEESWPVTTGDGGTDGGAGAGDASRMKRHDLANNPIS
jgi:hypothetical protein